MDHDFHQCYVCDKTFREKYNLNKHMKNVHSMEVRLDKQFKCNHCVNSYAYRKGLVHHLRKIHDIGKNKPKKNASVDRALNTAAYHNKKCSKCGDIFFNMKELRQHLSHIHKVQLESQKLSFTTKEEFEEWKDAEEARTTAQYVRYTGSQTNKNGDITVFFTCNRNGTYQAQTKDPVKRDRAIKGTGSKKIHCSCPSSMTVKIDNEGYHVTYMSTHEGHKKELGHMTLTKRERGMLAGKISTGASFDTILNSIRTSMQQGDWQRLQYAEPQDLRNIMREYNLKVDQLHEDDATSVHLWVQSMDSLGLSETPILYYKPVGTDCQRGILSKTDFMLVIRTEFPPVLVQNLSKKKICVDTTHGVNDHFELTSLMTVDEGGAGLPISFCFTNRKHTGAWNLFYNAVRQHYGVIETDVFMSDDDPAFYNAWCEVMGPAEKQLLCSWHINKNLKCNLQSKTSCSQEKRNEIWVLIRKVIDDTNVSKFNQNMQLLTHKLLNDSELEKFGEYFLEKYSKCPQKWAACYRVNAGINTNMYLESLHKVFKYFYLQGKKNKRVDYCIASLLRFARDKIFSRAIMIVKNKSTKRVKTIHQNHRKSLEYKNNNITVVSENKEWLVTSSSKSTTKYAVQLRENQQCDFVECRLKCRLCNICIHKVLCTCRENLIRDTICVHIHACLRLRSNHVDSSSIISTAAAVDAVTADEKDLVSTAQSQEDTEDMLQQLAESAAAASRITATTSQNHQLLLTKTERLITLIKTTPCIGIEISKKANSCLDSLLNIFDKTQLTSFVNIKTNQEILKRKETRSVKRLSPQKRFPMNKKQKKRPTLSLNRNRNDVLSQLRAPQDNN